MENYLTFVFLGFLFGVFLSINIWLYIEWEKRSK